MAYTDYKRELLRGHERMAKENFELELFGSHLAEEQKYKEVDGLDALRFYLMQKHNWLPSDVKAMSLEDMRFALIEEMHGWKPRQF